MDRKSRLQASIKEVLPQRKTAEEIERENFQKSQLQSITKAINNLETPVKEKHVRSTILGTYTDKGASLFWAYVRKLPLQGNAILCWKFCHVLHKLLREGHPNSLQDSYRHVYFLRDIGKLWGHLKQSYGKLIATYIKLLIQKLHFHKRNPQFPGNLFIPSDEHLYRLAEYDVNAYFQMAVEFLDYTDEILALQSAVFGSLDMSRSNSMTPTGQCRIAPLIPCIQDSTQLYDFTVKLLFKLHAGLPTETLSGHRDRFVTQFKALKQFFYSSGNLQYFKTLIQVPCLPELPPNFLIQSEDDQQTRHVTPVVVILPETDNDAAEPEVGELIDTRIPANESEIDIFGASTDFSLQGSPEINNGHNSDAEAAAAAALREREREEVVEQLTNRIKELEFELESLRAEQTQMVETMNQKISELEEKLEDSRTALNLAVTENKELKRALEHMPADTEEIEKRLEAEKQASQSEDKFKKMKDVYGKLREEHIQLLRSESEKKKQIAGQTEKIIQTEKSRHDLEERMLRVQADHVIMEKKLATADFSRVEALEKNLKEASRAKEAMEAKVKEVLSNERDLLQSKSNLEMQVEQLSKEADEAKESLKLYESEREDLISAKDQAIQELDLLRRNQIEISLAKEELQQSLNKTKSALTESESSSNHVMQELDSAMERLLEVENKHMEYRTESSRKQLEASCQQMVAMITSGLDEWENPLFAQVSCSAEYLVLQLESFEKDIFAHLKFLLKMVMQDSASNEEEIVEEITNTIPILGHHLSHVLITCQATSHRAPEVDKRERLSSCGHDAGQKGLELARLLKGAGWSDSIAAMDAIQENLNQIKEIGLELQPRIADVRADVLGSLVEQELESLTSIVEMASNRIAEMMEKSKETQSGIKLEVNGDILDSCTDLMSQIKILISRSRDLQNDIVLAGRGTATPNEFYQRNSRWTEGLLSAAKAVGMGAGVLVDAADNVVSGSGKFEELVVCSQEVAASTVQLVVASKVKAAADSINLKQLQEASKLVHHATARVVANAKSGAQKIEEKNLESLDFTKVTLHQAKRLEMDSQVRVLELETKLEKEREHLAQLRRKHYELAGGAEMEWRQDER